jgi:hypothetical protein
MATGGGVGDSSPRALCGAGADRRVYRIHDRREDLHAAVEVARHPVGARDVDLLVAAVGEAERAPVLEEAVDDRAHLDALGEARDARAQAADAAHEQLDLDARLRGRVERVDHVHVHERVHLRDDRAPCGPRGRGSASRAMSPSTASCRPSGATTRWFHFGGAL